MTSNVFCEKTALTPTKKGDCLVTRDKRGGISHLVPHFRKRKALILG